ncbi:deacylase, partial [Vibrio cholerae]
MAKAKKHGDFSFLGETIPPSSRRVIELEAAKLYTDSPLSIPIEVLHGASPGPVLM